jgi:hypothetical protein
MCSLINVVLSGKLKVPVSLNSRIRVTLSVLVHASRYNLQNCPAAVYVSTVL